jgi:hypothetical protein
MNRISFIVAVGLACALPALPQSGKAFVGRWDLTLTAANNRSWPQWMEIVDKDGKLDGRIQPQGGAVRPIVDTKMEGDHLLITVAKGTNNRPDQIWDLTVAGNKLSGTQKQGTNETKIEGVRAPELKRPMPKAWTEPEALFNGKDLTGWEPVNNPANSKWVVKDGTLFNEARGSNIRTTRTFGTEGGTQPNHEMGALYGFVAPKVAMPMGSGEWQVFDITLVGRNLTVVRNGKTIHENLEIPGITGGALDSNEGEPGPFFLQGDHDGGMAYRNIKIQLPKK